jgi:hypothetical protein
MDSFTAATAHVAALASVARGSRPESSHLSLGTLKFVVVGTWEVELQQPLTSDEYLGAFGCEHFVILLGC